MAAAVYLLCALTSILCGILLLREYRRRRTRLLLWSSLSFLCFAMSNALVFTDFVVLPDRDLSLIRATTACAAIALLVFGLAWDRE
jgi:hypothetical protein